MNDLWEKHPSINQHSLDKIMKNLDKYAHEKIQAVDGFHTFRKQSPENRKELIDTEFKGGVL
jgi:hypothetical protein